MGKKLLSIIVIGALLLGACNSGGSSTSSKASNETAVGNSSKVEEKREEKQEEKTQVASEQEQGSATELAKGNSEEPAAEQEEDRAQQLLERIKNKEESKDFKKRENSVVEYRGYNISIPQKWECDDISTSRSYFYFPEDSAYLALIYEEGYDQGLTTYNKNDWIEGCASAYDEFEVLSDKVIKIDGNNEALDFVFWATHDDTEYYLRYVTFITNYLDTVTLAMVQGEDAKLAYNGDFERIVKSIHDSGHDILADSRYDYYADMGMTGRSEEEKAEDEKAEALEESVIPSGQHKVGEDMPEGEYVVLATSGPGYFSVSSDANGRDILFNDNFDYNSIITVKNGEYLELSRCVAYPFDLWCETYVLDTSKTGSMFKIGVNLPAGEYKLETTADGWGYYCIYPDSRQSDIISNDNFEGSSYINVSDGQYLVLSRCVILE